MSTPTFTLDQVTTVVREYVTGLVGSPSVLCAKIEAALLAAKPEGAGHYSVACLDCLQPAGWPCRSHMGTREPHLARLEASRPAAKPDAPRCLRPVGECGDAFCSVPGHGLDADTRARYLSTIGHTYEQDHEGLWRCADCPGEVKWEYTPEASETACISRWLTASGSRPNAKAEAKTCEPWCNEHPERGFCSSDCLWRHLREHRQPDIADRVAKLEAWIAEVDGTANDVQRAVYRMGGEVKLPAPSPESPTGGGTDVSDGKSRGPAEASAPGDRFHCGEHGLTSVDEDGCCVTCGATAWTREQLVDSLNDDWRFKHIDDEEVADVSAPKAPDQPPVPAGLRLCCYVPAGAAHDAECSLAPVASPPVTKELTCADVGCDCVDRAKAVPRDAALRSKCSFGTCIDVSGHEGICTPAALLKDSGRKREQGLPVAGDAQRVEEPKPAAPVSPEPSDVGPSARQGVAGGGQPGVPAGKDFGY